MAEGIHVPLQEFTFTPATHSKKDRVTERQLDQMKQLSWQTELVKSLDLSNTVKISKEHRAKKFATAIAERRLTISQNENKEKFLYVLSTIFLAREKTSEKSISTGY